MRASDKSKMQAKLVGYSSEIMTGHTWHVQPGAELKSKPEATHNSQEKQISDNTTWKYNVGELARYCWHWVSLIHAYIIIRWNSRNGYRTTILILPFTPYESTGIKWTQWINCTPDNIIHAVSHGNEVHLGTLIAHVAQHSNFLASCFYTPACMNKPLKG